MWHDRTFRTFLICVPLILVAGYLKPQPVDPLLLSRNAEERFWMVKTHCQPIYDMVMMGDSRMYRDMSPSVMRGILPDWRILNFGYSSGGLNRTMFRAAEEKFDPLSKKKTIVLGVTPHSLTPFAAKNEHYNEKKHKRIDYIYSSIFLTRLEDFFTPIQVSNLFRKNKLPDRYYYQDFHDDGWVASRTDPEDPYEALASYRDLFTKNMVSDEIVKGVLDQTRDCVSRGIVVYAFRPPTAPAMKDLEDAISGFNEASFVRQFEAAGGVWLQVANGPYHSYDGSHLERSSAVKLSEYVASLIRKDLSDRAGLNLQSKTAD